MADASVLVYVVGMDDGAGFVGMLVDSAIAAARDADWVVRILSQDGVDYPVTRDARGNRMNFRVVAGRVSEARRG